MSKLTRYTQNVIGKEMNKYFWLPFTRASGLFQVESKSYIHYTATYVNVWFRVTMPICQIYYHSLVIQGRFQPHKHIICWKQDKNCSSPCSSMLVCIILIVGTWSKAWGILFLKIYLEIQMWCLWMVLLQLILRLNILVVLPNSKCLQRYEVWLNRSIEYNQPSLLHLETVRGGGRGGVATMLNPRIEGLPGGERLDYTYSYSIEEFEVSLLKHRRLVVNQMRLMQRRCSPSQENLDPLCTVSA